MLSKLLDLLNIHNYRRQIIFSANNVHYQATFNVIGDNLDKMIAVTLKKQSFPPTFT